MGAAESSNVSNVVTNVSNFVSNSTSADTTQISNIANSINIDECNIQLSGNFEVRSMANVIESSRQLVAAEQDTNMKNNIQQQMLQEATSKVGFLGIGYASASNSSNEMINSTNTVTNTVGTTSTQFQDVNNTFDCERSTIIANNINIGFNTNTDFLSSQVLDNTQVSNLVNNVSQSVTQKATATVEGIAGLIIAIILIFGVIVYGLGAPLSTGSAKIAVNAAMGAGLLGIFSFMYVKNTSPFFSKPTNCINHSAIGRGTGSDIPDCADMSNGEINLSSPPTRYTYSVLPSGNSLPGGNLLQMAIAQASGQSPGGGAGINGGYRVDTFNNLQITIGKYAKLATALKIPNIPNPLTITNPNLFMSSNGNNQYFQIPQAYINGICTPGIIQVPASGGSTDTSKCSISGYESSVWTSNTSFLTINQSQAVANLNNEEWENYVNMNGSYTPGIGGWDIKKDGNDESDVRALFARFVLCDIIGNIDLHVYINPKEYVKFPSEYNESTFGLAGPINSPTYPNDTYFYRPDNSGGSFLDGFTGSGVLKGQIGCLNDNQYKFEKFMKKAGIYIILGIVVSIMGYMAYTHTNNKKTK